MNNAFILFFFLKIIISKTCFQREKKKVFIRAQKLLRYFLGLAPENNFFSPATVEITEHSKYDVLNLENKKRMR